MSLKTGTGITNYDVILSMDYNGNPINTATFAVAVMKDGSLYSGLTFNPVLADPTTGTFSSPWSADTLGSYTVIYKNLANSVFFVTDEYQVVSDSDLANNIFIGL